MRLLSAMVLEYLNINARRIILAQAIRDLDSPVNAIVMSDESPDETRSRSLAAGAIRCLWRACAPRPSGHTSAGWIEEEKEREEKNASVVPQASE